jgi:signal transduction histidine kinase
VGPPDPDASLEELVREHAALRRVATLVAREPSPVEVFEAVAREVGTLLAARRAQLVRVTSPREGIVAASWSDGTLQPVPVGHRAPIDGHGVLGRMLRDPRPVRIEDWDEAGGGVAALMRSLGIRAGAAGPIVIGRRVWGAAAAVWSDVAEMPTGAEGRVAAFAELVAYAIENAEARDEIAASRARLVEAADEARRRIDRDLHDGAQQRLVAAALELTRLESQLGRDPVAAHAALARAREQLDGGLGEGRHRHRLRHRRRRGRRRHRTRLGPRRPDGPRGGPWRPARNHEPGGKGHPHPRLAPHSRPRLAERPVVSKWSRGTR